MIVGRLPGDNHVVDVTLAQARAGDAHKLSFLLQFRDAAATQVAHAGAQTADELEDHRLQRTAVGYASLNAFGNEFGQTVLASALALDDTLAAQLCAGHVCCALEVTLAGTLAHGCERAHAAVALEAASLEENGFARTLIDAGKE